MNTTIKFMYFANNAVCKEVINTISKEALYNREHFIGKFVNASGNNGTQKFFSWFMMLTDDNKKAVIDWIDNNYNG